MGIWSSIFYVVSPEVIGVFLGWTLLFLFALFVVLLLISSSLVGALGVISGCLGTSLLLFSWWSWLYHLALVGSSVDDFFFYQYRCLLTRWTQSRATPPLLEFLSILVLSYLGSTTESFISLQVLHDLA